MIGVTRSTRRHCGFQLCRVVVRAGMTSLAVLVARLGSVNRRQWRVASVALRLPERMGLGQWPRRRIPAPARDCAIRAPHRRQGEDHEQERGHADNQSESPAGDPIRSLVGIGPKRHQRLRIAFSRHVSPRKLLMGRAFLLASGTFLHIAALTTTPRDADDNASSDAGKGLVDEPGHGERSR